MIKLLDCTLRDGGYINDWNFGKDTIYESIKNLENSNVDILEIGFLKDEPYDNNRTVFNNMEQISSIISPKKKGILYAAMIEVVNPIPLEMLSPCSEETVDIIRVIVWKTKRNDKGEMIDALQDGFEYCKGVVQKGYKLCVQPARVDQYSDEEFVNMINKFSALNPIAIYVVDSWGTQHTENLIHYMELADKNMPEKMMLGYHGHNNMMQALGAAQAMINLDINRDVIIDASIYGIGRGAGNLNTEIIAKYLNDIYKKNYNISYFMKVFDNCVSKIHKELNWGYSAAFFITAVNRCNPNYANYYGYDIGLNSYEINSILSMLKENEKIIFSKENADYYLEQYRKKLVDNI